MNVLLEITVNHKLYYLNCLNCHKNLIIRNDCFNFQVQLCGLYSLQIGNIGSISDKLENLNSHFLIEPMLCNCKIYNPRSI
jgi:hypothetical protein